MLTEVNDQILAQLESLRVFKRVDIYAGEAEDLLKKATKLPGAFLVYGGAIYPDGPIALGTSIAATVQTWTVILLSKNLRSEGDGALECYTYIEQIREALTKFAVGGGWLWPVREELLLAEKGSLAYGLDFILETEV